MDCRELRGSPSCLDCKRALAYNLGITYFTFGFAAVPRRPCQVPITLSVNRGETTHLCVSLEGSS